MPTMYIRAQEDICWSGDRSPLPLFMTDDFMFVTSAPEILALYDIAPPPSNNLWNRDYGQIPTWFAPVVVDQKDYVCTSFMDEKEPEKKVMKGITDFIDELDSLFESWTSKKKKS